MAKRQVLGVVVVRTTCRKFCQNWCIFFWQVVPKGITALKRALKILLKFPVCVMVLTEYLKAELQVWCLLHTHIGCRLTCTITKVCYCTTSQHNTKNWTPGKILISYMDWSNLNQGKFSYLVPEGPLGKRTLAVVVSAPIVIATIFWVLCWADAPLHTGGHSLGTANIYRTLFIFFQWIQDVFDCMRWRGWVN